LFYIIVFYYFIIVSCFHLSLASWLLFSNKVQFSSPKPDSKGQEQKGKAPAVVLLQWKMTTEPLLVAVQLQLWFTAAAVVTG